MGAAGAVLAEVLGGLLNMKGATPAEAGMAACSAGLGASVPTGEKVIGDGEARAEPQHKGALLQDTETAGAGTERRGPPRCALEGGILLPILLGETRGIL